MLGKLDSCIIFVHAVGLGCNYYPPGNSFTSGINPQLDPTYYLLDYRSGKNVLSGPLYYTDFYNLCYQKRVNPRLTEDHLSFPAPDM